MGGGLRIDTLITMESNTLFHLFESSSAHHFVKLFLAILRCNNQEAAIEIL